MFLQKISPLLIFAAFVAVATFMLNMTAEARVYANEIDCSQYTDAAARNACQQAQQEAAEFCDGATGSDSQLCEEANRERTNRDYSYIAQECEDATSDRRTFCNTALNYNYTQGGVTLQDGSIMDADGNLVGSGGGNIGQIGSASDLGIPMVSANQPQLQNIFNILIMIAGALAVVFIMIGGVMYVISTGSPDRVEKAKNTILYAVIGLLVAVLAGAIMNFVVTSL